MRKPKYRAWDKVRSRMLSHSDLFKIDCSNEYPFLALIEGYYAKNVFPGEEMDIFLMESSLLKDVNGVDIFEGDIIKFRPLFKDHYEYHVVMRNKYSEWVAGSYLLSRIFKKVEVVGNIFEDSDLEDFRISGTEINLQED